jgi:hypothetical protein
MGQHGRRLHPLQPDQVGSGRLMSGDPALRGKLPGAGDAAADDLGCLPGVDVALRRLRMRWQLNGRGECLDLEQVDRAARAR